MLVHNIIDVAGHGSFGVYDQKHVFDYTGILLLDTDLCPLCQRFTSKVFFFVNGTSLINAGDSFFCSGRFTGSAFFTASFDLAVSFCFKPDFLRKSFV